MLGLELGESAVEIKAPTADPKSVPSVAPAVLQLPAKPRCRGGAVSTRNTTEVVYSPPTDTPWIIRNNTSNSDAVTPIDW